MVAALARISYIPDSLCGGGAQSTPVTQRACGAAAPHIRPEYGQGVK